MVSKSNEMWIAGGVVALGLAWYMMSDADAAPPPFKPAPPGPKPGPFTPSPSGGFKSLRCPNIEADLPDENKKEVDELIAAQLSSAEYGDYANQYQAAGWPNAAQCLAAAQLAAATREGLLSPKIPGGNSVDQTKTCAFWMTQYQNEVAKLNAAIMSIGSDPNATAKITSANAGIAHVKTQLAALGCPVP